MGSEDVQGGTEGLRDSAGESHELREGRGQQAVWPLGNREASCTKNGRRSLKSAETPSRALPSPQPERAEPPLEKAPEVTEEVLAWETKGGGGNSLGTESLKRPQAGAFTYNATAARLPQGPGEDGSREPR